MLCSDERRRTRQQWYREALHRGFQFARELDCTCGPVHFLVGISEGDGPAAAALADGDGPSLRSVVIAARDTLGKGGATSTAKPGAQPERSQNAEVNWSVLNTYSSP